jgi:uncharacterized membrane protein
MSTTDSRGPVEIAVIEFPGSRFNGEILPALAQLVGDGIVEILDLVVVAKDQDGTVTCMEIDQFGTVFDQLEGQAGGLLTGDDVAAAGETLSPGSTALALVWENTWARRLIDAVADSGGRLVAHDRLDADTVNAALADIDTS